jgi:microcin C transport system substrate-binding protein
MTVTRRELGRLALGAGVAAGLSWRAGATETIRAHGVSAFGDLKYGSDFTRFDYATPEGVPGGEFSSAVGGITFDSLNPFILKGNPAVLIPQLTFDTLMVGSADEPDAVYGLLAETVEYPEDRRWTAFELRPEARFADGTPVTAADVVFTYDILMEKGHPQYRVLLDSVAGAVAEDERRVRFDFHEGAPTRDLPMLVATLRILSKKFYETREFGDSTLEPPLGSGPYAIEEAEPGRKIVYRRRDDYWGWDLPVNRGRWHFGRIRYEYFRDRSAEFEAFKAGTFTFKEEFWSKLWATGYDFPAVNRGDIVRDDVPDNTPAGTQGYWFNLRRPVLRDVRVREAIGLAFDFEWSNETLFFNLYTRTDSFFEGGPMQAEGKPTPGELAVLEPLADKLPEGVLDEPAHVPPKTDGSGRNRRNLRLAARLLDAAGWTIEGGVRRNAAGEPLAVEFLTDSPSFQRITGPFIKNLERIGVRANSRVVDAAQYQKREDEFDFDIVVDRKSMSLTPGTELRAYFHSSSAEAQGSQNTAGVADPAVDELIEVIERAESRERLTSAVKALDRVLRAMHIWVPQWHKPAHHLAYWDIYGRPPVEQKPSYARGVLDLWWVDPEKAERLKDQVGG